MWNKNGFFHPCSPAKANGSARSTGRLAANRILWVCRNAQLCHEEKNSRGKNLAFFATKSRERLVESESKGRGSLHLFPVVLQRQSELAHRGGSVSPCWCWFSPSFLLISPSVPPYLTSLHHTCTRCSSYRPTGRETLWPRLEHPELFC